MPGRTASEPAPSQARSAGEASDRRRAQRRFRLAVAASAGVTLALAAWLLTNLGGAFATKAVDDVVETLAPLVAAALCWWAAGHRARAERLGWRLLAGACLSWGIGQGIWTVLEVGLQTTPFPSPADPFFLGFVPLAAAALLAFVGRGRGAWVRLRLLLDGLIASTAAFFVSWALLLEPLVRQSSDSVLARVLSLAYPLGDVVLVTMVLVVAMELRRHRIFGLITGGILALALADSSFAYLNLKGTYNGGVLDAAWVLGFLLLGLAALSPTTDKQRPAVGRGTWLGTLLPCAPVPVAVTILAVRIGTGATVEPLLAWLGGSSVLLIFFRQVFALRLLARSLEAKVQARTEALASSEDRFRSLLQHSSDAVLVLSQELAILYATESAERVLGVPPDELVGQSFGGVVDQREWARVATFLGDLAARPKATAVQDIRLRHGRAGWVNTEAVVVNLLDDPNVRGLVVTVRDVTERRGLEDQLRELAFHDPLTGLPNRALFHDRVGHALALSRRTGQPCGVLFVDLDDFKRVNDSLGHSAGDQLLIATAHRISGVLRASDSVARLGGDEFAILAEDFTDASDVTALGDRLLEALRRPVEIDGRSILPQASIGIATTTTARETVEELLRNADVAMYQAKGRGKSCYEVFRPAMHLAAIQRLELEEQLRRAVEREEFVVHYQPVVRLADGSVSGVEALLRWQHPERGLLLPGEFIPLAEETGLIVPIGAWTLARACRDVAALQREPGLRKLRVAVNLSSRQLADPGLEDHIAAVLASSGLDPITLVLEITESVLMTDTAATIERMERLRRTGPSFAMDDFGTGYSSLGYLRRYPIQILKIDRSFVVALGEGAEDTALVLAILSLANTLGMEVVAEGIEHAWQAGLLHRLGCALGQGFHFAKPMEIARLREAMSPGAGMSPNPANVVALRPVGTPEAGARRSDGADGLQHVEL